MPIMSPSNVRDLCDQFVSAHGYWYALHAMRGHDMRLCATPMVNEVEKPFYTVVLVAVKIKEDGTEKGYICPEMLWTPNTEQGRRLLEAFRVGLELAGMPTKTHIQGVKE